MNRSTPEVAALAGRSVRVIDHWVRQGYLRLDQAHPGTGYRRDWPPAEVDVARRMAAMVAAGVTPAAAARAARADGWLSDRVRVVLDPAPPARPRRPRPVAVARAARRRRRQDTR